MEQCLITGSSGSSIEFLDRTPTNATAPIERFRVRVKDENLAAEVFVYAGEYGGHPAKFFEEMAESWQGWTGERKWGSLEDEIGLRATRDPAGHIYLRVELRSDVGGESGWNVAATITIEAGQLEEIARQATLFFGSE
jgi:hypothetical protein